MWRKNRKVVDSFKPSKKTGNLENLRMFDVVFGSVEGDERRHPHVVLADLGKSLLTMPFTHDITFKKKNGVDVTPMHSNIDKNPPNLVKEMYVMDKSFYFKPKGIYQLDNIDKEIVYNSLSDVKNVIYALKDKNLNK